MVRASEFSASKVLKQTAQNSSLTEFSAYLQRGHVCFGQGVSLTGLLGASLSNSGVSL